MVAFADTKFRPNTTQATAVPTMKFATPPSSSLFVDEGIRPYAKPVVKRAQGVIKAIKYPNMPSITPKKAILIEENGQLYEEGIELKDARFGKVHRLYRLQRIEVEGRNEEIYVRTEEKLAVKKLHKRAILYNREKAENPLHEIAALQLLLNATPDHNNIPYIDCFADNEIIYLVTPYYSSGDLLDLIFQKQSFGQTFTITEMKEMFTQLTAQLHSIHNLGIVHRDLSLENILYDKESKRYTIIDYGMSMWLNEEVATTTEPQNIFIDDMDAMAASNEEKESSCMIVSAPSSPAYSSSSSAMTSFASPSTSSSYSSSMYDRFARVSKYIVCGKQHYMAPEIWANETDLQLMYSDVWSLGVIFFMVLMFQAPFASSKRSDPNFHFYLHNGQCLEELILQLNNDLPIFASKPVEEHKAYEQLIDLMGHMLRPNLHERYTIEDVMNHPFFQN